MIKENSSIFVKIFMFHAQKGSFFCTITLFLCNKESDFLKKVCTTQRKCVTLHPISAKGCKNFKIAKSLLTF